MIHHTTEKENLENAVNKNFISAIKELQISSLLHQCGIRKTTRAQKGEESGEKRTAFEIFQFLLLMAFQGCNLYRFLGSKKQNIACSKNTYNRFHNDCHYNWRRFITLLAARVIACFDTLTCHTRFKALVIDDSVINRNRSKKVELLAKIFDHVTGKTVKGFNLLTIGWTDGYSFVPVAFNMLSSANLNCRVGEIKETIDKRTVGFKNRLAATLRKPDAAMEMILSALKAGIKDSIRHFFTGRFGLDELGKALIVAIGIILFNFAVIPWFVQRQIRETDYGTFITMTENKEIGEVQIQSNQILFTDKDGRQIYKTGLMDDPDLVNRLTESGATFSSEIVEEASPFLSFLLTWILPTLIFIGIGQFMSKKMISKAGGPGSMMFNTGNHNAKVYVKSSNGITFSDVEGEEEAKDKAPCIVFIDEIDAIGQKRNTAGTGGNDEREQTLNQLLTEMDGFEGNNGVIILAATNRPESLDPALTRPGRFDSRVPVELPDIKGREAILKVHAKKIKVADNVDFKQVARMASGASNDIEQATKLARAMVTRYGMSEEFDMVAMETVSNQYLGDDTSLVCSQKKQAMIDDKVIEIVKKQHEKAIRILMDNRKKLRELSEYLYEKETITGEEFMEILNS